METLNTADEFGIVSALIVSGSYCVACIGRKAAISPEHVMEAFRRIELEWSEPVIGTGRCTSCLTTTTVYSLRIP